MIILTHQSIYAITFKDGVERFIYIYQLLSETYIHNHIFFVIVKTYIELAILNNSLPTPHFFAAYVTAEIDKLLAGRRSYIRYRYHVRRIHL